MLSGTAYGVVLNDRRQLDALTTRFTETPYHAAPIAPVLYIKPRGCVTASGAPVLLPEDIIEIEAAATVGLLFGRDMRGVQASDALAGVAAACLALEVSEPHGSFYRPAIRQRCRDGFLPIGAFVPFEETATTAEIMTLVDGVETHRWSLDRLVRNAATLIADISAFMTLAAGDLLLLGLPGDAPRLRSGQAVELRSRSLPRLRVAVDREPQP